MTQENQSTEPEPATLRPPIAIIDDDGCTCSLEDSGHSLLVNIMRIGQHWGRARLLPRISTKGCRQR